MNLALSIALASVILHGPVTASPNGLNMVRIQCPDSMFTNYNWSALVSQDMQTWWEFPQASPENRLITFIPACEHPTFVRLVGYPKTTN